jgi:hypothetical protein
MYERSYSLHIAKAYLHLLDDGSVFTFQSIDDSNAGDSRLARVFHGPFEQHVDALLNLNANGAGIFVMVNAGDGMIHPGSKTCRTVANVKRVRALFLDLDGAPVAPVLQAAIPPHWVVESSPGRWHAYWRIDDCPLHLFSGAQLALADRFNGDRTVIDLPRVLRIPGFVHRKATPFVSRLFTPDTYESVLKVSHDR